MQLRSNTSRESSFGCFTYLCFLCIILPHFHASNDLHLAVAGLCVMPILCQSSWTGGFHYPSGPELAGARSRWLMQSVEAR